MIFSEQDKYSRSMNTDAKNLVSCPKCNQLPTLPCRTLQGRKCNYLHMERTRALRGVLGFSMVYYTRYSPNTTETLRQGRMVFNSSVPMDYVNRIPGAIRMDPK